MKKLRSQKGFTLTEMLISVLLLGLVSVMVTVMTSAVLGSTVTMQAVAQAEILGNEALENVQGKLRVADSVTATKKSGTAGTDTEVELKFDINNANKGYSFGIADGKIVLDQSNKDGDTVRKPLFEGVSYDDLKISDLHFTLVDNKRIKIFVEVSYNDKLLWKGNVTVEPLNGITI